MTLFLCGTQGCVMNEGLEAAWSFLCALDRVRCKNILSIDVFSDCHVDGKSSNLLIVKFYCDEAFVYRRAFLEVPHVGARLQLEQIDIVGFADSAAIADSGAAADSDRAGCS